MSPAPDYICLACSETFDHAQVIGDFCPDCSGDLTDYTLHMRAEQRRAEQSMDAAMRAYDAHVERRQREEAQPLINFRIRQAS